jgi:subtilisin family serine protease
MFALGQPPWADDGQESWGISATGADQSRYTGAGVKLAVLDTGIDLAHPDFVSRQITHASFVPGETVDDIQGHGTHCAGMAAAGSPTAVNVPRYGVAPDAELFIAKVLNNRGTGRQLDIIAGIQWALENGCDIISMSLGRAAGPQEPFDPRYEDIAAEALAEGCLIVAATGNDSARRYRYVAPVGSPANAPSIMAVAAIEADGQVAPYSNGGVGTGRVDMAAPGSDVFSSVPRPQLYRRLSGTSMACPHVAGVAALWAESDPYLRGQKLWDQLIAAAAPLAGQSTIDIGAGLVKVP